MKKLSRKKRRITRFAQLICVAGFICILCIGWLTGCLFFIRPVHSEAEMRDLTSFPSFTLTSFLDGTYFSDISLWYSDTYPGRDTLMVMQHNVESLYGFSTGTQMVGTVAQSDEIPDEISDPAEAKAVEIPENYALDADVQNQIMNSLYVENGAAYSVYAFNQNAAAVYTNALNDLADELDGEAEVYSLLVPVNSCILPEETMQKLGGADQNQAIDYYFSLYDKVTGIPVIDDLQEHREDEYLYFRTDHHWTTQAAWHAYDNFCKLKGFETEQLDDLESMTFSPFLGTFYTQLQLAEMAANPDSVTAYIPNATNEMVYWDENGNEIAWPVINDVSTWNENSGYYCFIAGDRPRAMIDNPEIEDGSAVLVLKESYGNSFIPFLVDHYDKVYIADYRYTDIDISDFVRENGIDDVIFEGNLTIIASDEISSRIASLI